MALIYITGISGTGKTAVAAELKARGYEAYDADGDGFNSWYDKKTNRQLDSSDDADPHTPQWYEKYAWKTSRAKVEELASRAKNKTIFLCGVSSNEEEIWDLSSKVICLDIDENTLRHRIVTRTSNDYGKEPHEFADILRGHKSSKETFHKSDNTIIDATKPLDEVVEEILKLAA